MSRHLVKRLSEVRTAPSGVMVTHFTRQNLAHMGPKKPVRESLSIPGPARKNEIAGQQRGAVRRGAPWCAKIGRWLRLLAVLAGAQTGRVRRGDPDLLCGACEPVGQHGGGGLPREPWIGAVEPERQTFEFPLPSPRRTPQVFALKGERSAVEVVHARCAGLDISKRDAKVCVRVAGAGRRKTVETVTTWGSMTSQILALREHLIAERISCAVMEATSDYVRSEGA